MEIKIILVGIIVFIMISMVLNENQPCYQPPFGAIKNIALIIFWVAVAILILLLLEMYLNEKAVQKCQKEK